MKRSKLHVTLNCFWIALAFAEHYVFKNEFEMIFTFLLAITANITALVYYIQITDEKSATDEA